MASDHGHEVESDHCAIHGLPCDEYVPFSEAMKDMEQFADGKLLFYSIPELTPNFKKNQWSRGTVVADRDEKKVAESLRSQVLCRCILPLLTVKVKWGVSEDEKRWGEEGANLIHVYNALGILELRCKIHDFEKSFSSISQFVPIWKRLLGTGYTEDLPILGAIEVLRKIICEKGWERWKANVASEAMELRGEVLSLVY